MEIHGTQYIVVQLSPGSRSDPDINMPVVSVSEQMANQIAQFFGIPQRVVICRIVRTVLARSFVSWQESEELIEILVYRKAKVLLELSSKQVCSSTHII